MNREDYPFQDEPWGHHAEREYRHNWDGMPSRHAWNADPLRASWNLCPGCGYKWGAFDFIYRNDTKLNGAPAPACPQPICWNCWMVENRGDYVRNCWDKAGRRDAVKGKGSAPSLERL